MVEVKPKLLDRSEILVRGSNKVHPAGKKEIKRKIVRGADSELYTSICPVVYAIRIFGLAPYEFHEDELVSSSVNSIFSYVCIVFYSYIIYTIVLRFTSSEMEGPILGHTEVGKAVCNYFVTVVDIIMTLILRDKFVKIWNVIQDFDEIVKNLGYPRKETKTCIYSWCLLLANVLMWLTINQSGMIAFNESWSLNVQYMVIYIGSCASVVKFSGIAMLLGQRFDHLNEIAKKNGPSTFRWLISSPIVDTKEIERLHNVLMATSEYLNSLYTWSLLLWLGNLTFHLVSDFFFVSQRMISTSWDLGQWRMLICLVLWVIEFLCQLILLTFACDFASTEANGMGYIMITWRRWIKNSTLYRGQQETVGTSIHLINRRLNFSAAGCFHVNLPLLRSAATLLATYLVILLQFPE